MCVGVYVFHLESVDNVKQQEDKRKEHLTIGVHLIDKLQIVLNSSHILYIKVTVNFKKLR